MLIDKLNVKLLVFMLVFFSFCKKTNSDQVTPPPATNEKTFINPLQPGSDPWVIKKDSFYYYTQTSGNKIALWRTKAMSKLNSALVTTVFSPQTNTPNSSNIWAPELHFINSKWYIYYAAGSGPDSTQRMFVLENSGSDPLSGTWTEKGRIFAGDANFWSIDATVFNYNGNDYLIWSGRPDLSVQNQNIYIARMANAWTIQPPTIMISQPTLSWEMNGGRVNEGPEILKNNTGQVFLVYSASGCWTDDYNLGMLTLTGSDPLVAANWTKTPEPIFEKAPQNKAYGPGHNGFFKSPDATEDWIIYHANNNTGEGCGVARNIRMQKFTWNADGTPNFGSPVKSGTALPVPSGE